MLTLGISLQSWCAVDSELNDKYETFKDVQNIKKILAELTEKFTTLDFPLSDGSGWPEPNLYCDKTQQGLFITISDRPQHLKTPWVKVALRGSGSLNHLQSAAFTLAFLQRVTVQLCHIPQKECDEYDTPTWYTVSENASHLWKNFRPTTHYMHDIYHRISTEDALTKIGTNCLLKCNFSGINATYKVFSIDGKKVPDSIEIDDESTIFASAKATEQEWSEFKHRYQHEEIE
jgi:hypothetical protein